ERGKLRADVFRSITQQCRDPHYVGLDLKARIASNNVAAQRLLALIEAYGGDFVTSASIRLMEEGEQLAKSKLRSLPDGAWRSRMYRSTTVSVNGKEEVRPYKAMCTLTKKGEHLTFDATGSSPQNEDHRNATYVCSWSKLFEALAGFTFWDLPWNQGMTNPVTLIAPEGSVVNCKYPASCGLGTLVGGYLSGAAMDCIARMMYAGGHREGVNASWRGNFGDGGPYYWYGGHNQFGGIVGQGIYDLFGGGQGATPTRDGNHSGGIAESAQSAISDVEFTEMYFPFLYLSRNHMPDSGGCGKFAGGMTLESVMMIYGTKDLTVDYVPAPISSQVTGLGLFGGYPMGTGLAGNKVIKTQNMPEKIQDGCYPTTLEEAEAGWGVDVRNSPEFHI
ncbi:MAG: hydantoinase B/oxoprolinase family protein, partial [Dehalococcoidia bacterium]|nr:hydantoinase B/oxoprolinase family protein [Dehalococcoidia bacterium]